MQDETRLGRPLVAIILLNWNGLEDTLECLASLDKLTYPTVEVIVVDNGSEGDQAAAIADAFPKTTVLAQKENLGFCGGCNVGIKYALEHGAAYVMLLNNDTIVSPDLIEELLKGTEGLENPGAISPLILSYPDTNRVWYSDAYWIPGTAQFRLERDTDEPSDLGKRHPYETQFACGCCLLASTDAFKKVGVLDERYFAFYEEADWCARSHRLGFTSYVVPRGRIFHKGSRSTPSFVAVYLMTRNRLLWMKDNLTFFERLRSFLFLSKEVIWHAANLAGLTGSHFSKRHSRIVLRSYADYFRGRFYRWPADLESLLFTK
jgi:GT2 family glycosyltransferase